MLNLTRQPKTPLTVEMLRPLTSDDMAQVFEERALRPQRLQRITSRHHALARYIAGGYTRENAAILAGYSVATVNSVLMNDPTFLELVEFYKSDEVATLRSLQEKMLGIGLEAAELLQQRMEEQPDKITVGQLLEIHRTMADRTGHGPKTVSETNVNISIGERLNAAKNRLKLIEGKVNESFVHFERDS